MYERVYDCIPGKGILKGITASFAIWLIKDIADYRDTLEEEVDLSTLLFSFLMND